MLSPSLHDVPVLIAGAGPTGLAAALELSRHEVPCLVVERRPVLSSHPRATGLSLRSMELVRAWGLDAAIRARGVEVHSRMLELDTLAAAGDGRPIDVGYPTAAESRMVSPTTPACVAQDDVETVLLDHLRTMPGAQVALGTELTAIAAGPDGARAELRDVVTGETRSVEARWVIAADGARSAVRRALGIALAGADDLLSGTTTLFRAPLWDVVGEHRYLLYSVTHPEAPATFLPGGAGDRWLVGLADAGRTPPADAVATLIRHAAGVARLPVRVERSRHFSSGAQVAERWRSGCVFLAGDAAHRVTPRGGMGLNISLHDGYDLAWRLAWVLRGWAGPEVLDGYEAERRPVAEYVAVRSADPDGSRRTAQSEARADLGARLPHAWTGARSTLDLLEPGLTLFAARDQPGWERAAAALRTRVPVAARLVEPIVARTLGAPGGSALLARSDGTPVAVLGAGGDPAPSLRAAVAAAVREPRAAQTVGGRHMRHSEGPPGSGMAPCTRKPWRS